MSAPGAWPGAATPGEPFFTASNVVLEHVDHAMAEVGPRTTEWSHP